MADATTQYHGDEPLSDLDERRAAFARAKGKPVGHSRSQRKHAFVLLWIGCCQHPNPGLKRKPGRGLDKFTRAFKSTTIAFMDRPKDSCLQFQFILRH